MAGSWNKRVGGWGGVERRLAHEDGKIYRGLSQDMDPVIKHVSDTNELVNQGRSSGSKLDKRYVGSVPFNMLQEWCWKEGVGIDEWARDKDLKAKFLAHWQSNEFSKFHAKDYQANKWVGQCQPEQSQPLVNSSQPSSDTSTTEKT